MNKPQVIFDDGCFLSGFQDCRQGYQDVFTPCLEGQIENNLQLVNSHLKENKSKGPQSHSVRVILSGLGYNESM